jgi:hypothetical protein
MNEHVGCSNIQWNGNAMNDVSLPKFSDSSKQNVVGFLTELSEYFKLRAIPKTLKLPLAIRSITDGYTRQWVTAVERDLKSFEQFCQAITELLWSREAQAEARTAIYQGRCDKNESGSLSGHLLKYYTLSAYLSPKMSELDLISSVIGHYPAFIQRALLSANVKTVQ